MKLSLKGHLLPENQSEAEELFRAAKRMFTSCLCCGKSLAAAGAASTRAGWLETQISGTCEPCFDELFKEQ